jgi:hypothetical protein
MGVVFIDIFGRENFRFFLFYFYFSAKVKKKVFLFLFFGTWRYFWGALALFILK